MTAAITDFRDLSIAERIQLVEDLWDSIAAEAPEAIQLTELQKAELHRRLQAHEAQPSSGIPWEQVRDALFQQKS